MLHHFHGQLQLFHFLRSWLSFAHHLQFLLEKQIIPAVNKKAAADLFQIQLSFRRRCRDGRKFHQTDVGLLAKDFQGFLRKIRGNDDFHKDFMNLLCRFPVDGPVCRNDSTEDGNRIRFIGLAIGFINGIAHRDPAWVGMLYGHDSRFFKFFQGFQGPVGIVDVVEGQLFSMELNRPGQGSFIGADLFIIGGLLMRVLPIAQLLGFFKGQGQSRRQILFRFTEYLG